MFTNNYFQMFISFEFANGTYFNMAGRLALLRNLEWKAHREAVIRQTLGRRETCIKGSLPYSGHSPQQEDDAKVKELLESVSPLGGDMVAIFDDPYGTPLVDHRVREHCPSILHSVSSAFEQWLDQQEKKRRISEAGRTPKQGQQDQDALLLELDFLIPLLGGTGTSRIDGGRWSKGYGASRKNTLN